MMYGLLGSPVGKSWSEVLFNRIFELEENNNIYTAINVSPVTLKRLMEKIDMSFQGFNVTIPYKEDVLRYTEEHIPAIDCSASTFGSIFHESCFTMLVCKIYGSMRI